MAREGPKWDSYSAIRRAIRRLLRALPPDRRAAATMIARGVGYFLRGELPPSWATSQGAPLDPRREDDARIALEAGRFTQALAAADSILASRPRHVGALEVRALALAATGEVSEAYRIVRRLQAVADGPRVEELQGRLIGELRVARPGWLPRLAGSPRQTGEPLERRILLLSADRAAGEAAAAIGRAAGYDPVLVLAPLTEQDGAIEGPAPGTVDQTSATLVRLDLGPIYPPTAPLDRRLEDLAWLSSRVVEQVRPALVHVTGGAALLERAAIGESLRSRYPVALVVEAGAAPRPDQTPGSELARLRHVAQERRFEAADSVVTPMPAGAADRRAVDRLGEAYAEALARRAERT